MICPICDREIPNKQEDRHHLTPKTFKGKELVSLHKVCHRTIHSIFTERELLNYYHTIDRLKEHEGIQKFAKWVAKKPLDFYISTKDTNIRKGKRRR